MIVVHHGSAQSLAKLARQHCHLVEALNRVLHPRHVEHQRQAVDLHLADGVVLERLAVDIGQHEQGVTIFAEQVERAVRLQRKTMQAGHH